MKKSYYELEAPSKDLKIVEDVAEYLRENYTDPLDQGPIWLTGSSLHVADPGDYDLVVQRNFKDVPTEADQKAVAKLLNKFQQENIDYSSDMLEINKELEACKHLNRTNNVNLYPEPVRRFQLNIQDVPIDLSFNNESPVDEALKILR